MRLHKKEKKKKRKEPPGLSEKDLINARKAVKKLKLSGVYYP